MGGFKLVGTPADRMNPENIPVHLSDSAQDKIVSTRIRIARNFSMFPLNTGGSKERREALIDGHQLFRGGDKMQAASGYHEHWPHGRGVFHNPEKTFVNWVNEGDHIRIISMEYGGDVKAVFSRLAAGAKEIEEGVRKETGVEDVFMMHPKFGSVACCPSNLGTGMRGGVHILVPKLIKSMF